MTDNNILVVVEDYNTGWGDEFEKIKRFLQTNNVLKRQQIEHVGSTSVVGLAAKPIIDIDIIVKLEEKRRVLGILCAMGYTHLGDLGITGREAFRLELRSDLMKHNLYLCEEGSLAVKNHLNWRNYLRSSEKVRAEYAELKKALAKRYYNDIEAYCSAKTEFIIQGLAKFLPDSDLADIREQNMK